MTDKVIPLIDLRSRHRALPLPGKLESATGLLLDSLERPLRDLRISVTDRCNFRCVYCMPKEVFDKDHVFLPQTALLSFEEITRLAKIAVDHGVEKIRLTGGEPLLRKHLEKLIEMLARLRTHSGAELDLTLTTNGSILAKKARALKDAGLKRVTVSLDSLDEAIFQKMNDVDFPVAEVLRGIDAAHAAGLGTIKINMVVKRGVNDQEIVPMAKHFKNSPFVLRFIEYMDVGASNGWKMDEVISSADIVRTIGSQYPLEPITASYAGETASRWRYVDGSNEIGLISSVTGAFCGDCSRIRLSTEGQFYTCLFATGGHDVRTLLRNGCSDAQISTVMAQIWRARTDRYSALRTADTVGLQTGAGKVEMSYIGG